MADRRSLILQLHGSGVTPTEIARRLGLARATVEYHLRRSEPSASPEPPQQASIAPAAEGRSRFQVSTRSDVGRLLATGLTRAETARRLGISKSTVSYHARRLGEPVDDRCARRYDWDAVQAFHDAGHGVRECIRHFGFSSETWHAAARRGRIAPRNPFLSTEEVFAAGVPRNRGHLKRRLLSLGLRSEVCDVCGLSEWREAPLSLALHHVNGKRNDNRLENLQLLCPNCHSQTDNFAGRRRPAADPD